MDRVQADHFARQEKTLHLLVAVGIDDIGFDGAATHCRNRVEIVAFAKNMIAFAEGADVFDQHMQILQGILAETFRQAGA